LDCGKTLSLPSIHFLCGHSYHESCAMFNQHEERMCLKCFDEDNQEPKDILDKKEYFVNIAHNED